MNEMAFRVTSNDGTTIAYDRKGSGPAVVLVGGGQCHLILDLENVEFMDSTGLGVLVGALKRVRNHDGSLSVVRTQENIIKIFRITGLSRVFPFHANVAAASAAPAALV